MTLSTVPAKTTANNRSNPCTKAERRSRPPAETFAPERTITEVTGRPPKNPESAFAIPCAKSSRFGGLCRFSGSSRSIACSERSVSILATMAMVTATIQTSLSMNAPKSGRGRALASAENPPSGTSTN